MTAGSSFRYADVRDDGSVIGPRTSGMVFHGRPSPDRHIGCACRVLWPFSAADVYSSRGHGLQAGTSNAHRMAGHAKCLSVLPVDRARCSVASRPACRLHRAITLDRLSMSTSGAACAARVLLGQRPGMIASPMPRPDPSANDAAEQRPPPLSFGLDCRHC